MAQIIGHDPLADTSCLINQGESLDLVCALLSASFGCLAYLRGLFDDDNFDESVLALTRSSSKSSTDNLGDNHKPRKDYVRLKRVKRGCTQEADTFLDWLEHGAFDALGKRYIQSIILAILTKESDGAKTSVCECYCFNVSYRSDGEAVFEMHDNRGNIVKMDCRKSIQQLIKRFIIITQGLPALPQNKSLTMRLVYSDLCPPDYQPHGFRDIKLDKELDKIYFSLDNSHSITRSSAGNVNCGYHRVSLKVLALAETHQPLSPDKSCDYTKLDCLDEVDDHPQLSGNSSKPRDEEDLIDVPDSQQNLATPDNSLSNLARALERNTQHSVISDTQLSSCIPNTLPGYVDSLYREECDNNLAGITASGIVKCICKSAQDDFGASMIQCGKCTNWVHICCYGFRGDQDPRIGDDYKCMDCSGFQFNTDKLKSLALFRRAFMAVQEEGCPQSGQDFSLWLGCDMETATVMMASLIEKGIVKPKSSRTSSSSNFSLSTGDNDDWPGNRRKYHVVSNKRLQSRIMRQYFDPENNHFEE